MKYLLTVICFLVTFTSCHNDDDDPVVTPKGRTVLIYMSAENNLSSYAATNLNQMVKGSTSLNANDHLIVFFDQKFIEQTEYKKAQMPYIAEISKGEITKVKEFTSDINAADPREMHDIINWTVDNYPAEDYGLVLWGHATGWLFNDSVPTRSNGPKRAYGIDSGSGKWMNIPSMAKYIAESNIKFHYIFADACCFQSIENAYELRNVTDLLIGAPSEIPGDGAPYDAIIPYFFSNKTDFYKGIIEEYEKCYELQGYSVPLSVIKTDEMDELALAAHEVWKDMPQPWPTSDNVVYYFTDNNKKFYFDALNIVMANTTEATTHQWSSALNKAVIYSNFNTEYKWMTDPIFNIKFSDFTLDISRMAIVSMFVPLEIYESGNAQYNQMIKKLSWYKASGLADIMK